MTVAHCFDGASDFRQRKKSFSACAPVFAAFARCAVANERRAGSDDRGKKARWLASESH